MQGVNRSSGSYRKWGGGGMQGVNRSSVPLCPTIVNTLEVILCFEFVRILWFCFLLFVFLFEV